VDFSPTNLILFPTKTLKEIGEKNSIVNSSNFSFMGEIFGGEFKY
jgi:hypothetical protein